MFLTLGYKSVTMDDIAAELGISKKTIYQHFANKTELVEASTMDLFTNISCGVDAICEMGKNAIEEMFMIRSFMMQNLHNEDASPFYQLQKFFPEIFSQLRMAQFNKMHGCKIENLKKGVDEGLFRKEIDIDFVSRIYFTGLTGTKDKEIFPTSIYNMQEMTRQYLEYHLRAIVSDKGLEVLEKELVKLTNS